MDVKDLMGKVVDALYDGLTGGSAELPLPDDVMINWIQPGIPFHESAFDFAIAGPFSGPTPLTLPYFRELVETLMGPQGGEGGEGGVSREEAVEQAKLMYQQHLLGTWEQWSRLVDFIPLPTPTPQRSRWLATGGQGKYKHVSVVYGQAGLRLSELYEDTLRRCEVADEQLTAEQQAIVDRMRALLMETVEVEDFLTGEKTQESRDSRAMTAYKAKKSAYENAVTDYASRLARANGGSAQDLIEWQRSGGIYRRRATEALRDWEATGYKLDVERAQSTLNHILGSSMVQWKTRLLESIDDINNNTTGQFGYPFFPATVLPGSFARSDGWSEYDERHISRRSTSSSSSHSGSGAVGFSLGFFSIGGGGGHSVTEHQCQVDASDFGMHFSYTTVEISRPAFNPGFFSSRGWRPTTEFVADHGPQHSDGAKPPKGAMIGYATRALFVRDLTIYSSAFASFVRSMQSQTQGGGMIGIGPFCIGGKYQQTNREDESNLQVDTASITVRGLQLVGFLSALIPKAADPNPDVTAWI
ncbi:hypothetical protein DT076_10420 [Desertihabitans brevis]|uniref:Uncharacterized protein n=1 Tax=Desertihabitans brevis TaxID=2268447 RepID=A0A367YUU9_9ACTN|nr:hypothetical protein [Desertihabitans brevis]RCK69309.1 hypothetical protein DT076_10420 [Desertihabitans brevis]